MPPVLALVIAIAAFSPACGSRAEPGDGVRLAADGPTVVATTAIWADVLANLLCLPTGSIPPMIPPGADPHGYRPSLSQAESIRTADIVVANGGGLEGALFDLVEDRNDAGGTVLFATDLAGEDGTDPHIWLDPTLVMAIVEALGPRLVGAGTDAKLIEECQGAYLSELEELDREIMTQLSTLEPENRQMVTNHDSLGHFSQRYGLEVVGTVLPSSSTLAEANPHDLELLRAQIMEHEITTIFSDHDHSSAEVDALVARLEEVTIVPLNVEALGAVDSGPHTYIELMGSAAATITEALEGVP